MRRSYLAAKQAVSRNEQHLTESVKSVSIERSVSPENRSLSGNFTFARPSDTGTIDKYSGEEVGKVVADHPNKHIREALKYAERQGWTVRKSSGRAHAWGLIYCQFGHRECWMSIYSTPRNPEAHARDIHRTVDRCPGE